MSVIFWYTICCVSRWIVFPFSSCTKCIPLRFPLFEWWYTVVYYMHFSKKSLCLLFFVRSMRCRIDGWSLDQLFKRFSCFVSTFIFRLSMTSKASFAYLFPISVLPHWIFVCRFGLFLFISIVWFIRMLIFYFGSHVYRLLSLFSHWVPWFVDCYGTLCHLQLRLIRSCWHSIRIFFSHVSHVLSYLRRFHFLH